MVNWAGFYVIDRRDITRLILGPFHGKVACQTIKLGKGVCGTAAGQGKTIMLQDVNDFPGHIACDGESKSEIVAAIRAEGKVSSVCVLCQFYAETIKQVVGVIDIDCAEMQGFDDSDKEGLEAVAALLGDCCDWTEFLS